MSFLADAFYVEDLRPIVQGSPPAHPPDGWLA